MRKILAGALGGLIAGAITSPGIQVVGALISLGFTNFLIIFTPLHFFLSFIWIGAILGLIGGVLASGILGVGNLIIRARLATSTYILVGVVAGGLFGIIYPVGRLWIGSMM